MAAVWQYLSDFLNHAPFDPARCSLGLWGASHLLTSHTLCLTLLGLLGLASSYRSGSNEKRWGSLVGSALLGKEATREESVESSARKG